MFKSSKKWNRLKTEIFPKISICQTSWAMILLARLGIKRDVHLATLWALYKLLSLGSWRPRERILEVWVHSTWCSATIWRRGALVDGLSWMDIWLRQVEWWLRIAHHIWLKLGVRSAATTAIAQPSLKSKRVTNCRRPTKNLSRKKS